MTRRNPERPPGPSSYRRPAAAWTMIGDAYLSGWTQAGRGQAFHDRSVAEAANGRGEDWTSLKQAPPESLRQGPRPLPGMVHRPWPAWSPPEGFGPMPPHRVPPRPPPAARMTALFRPR